MSGRDPADGDDIRREAARWLAVAADDRRIAEACLGLDPPALGGSAYHCQQAAEKIVKGLLEHVPLERNMREARAAHERPKADSRAISR